MTGQSEEGKKTETASKVHKECQAHLQWGTTKSPIVKFMQTSMAKIGSPFPSDHFLCAPCAVPASGHYNPSSNVTQPNFKIKRNFSKEKKIKN